MGGIGGNYSEQSSSNQASSGFMPKDKRIASEQSMNRLFGMADFANRELGSAVPQYQFSSALPGLFKEQEGWANAFANNLFSKVSGGGALRGQFSPNNTPGIVGSALTNAAPTILPMIGQNLYNSFMVPEQIKSQRFANSMSPLQALISGLGSVSQGTSSGFGVGGQMYMGGGGGGGGGIG